MNIKIAVLTLVKGRHQALLNLVAGLLLNITDEIELIVIHMNEEVCILPDCPFPVRSFSFHSAEQLPLARARNLAVSKTDAPYCIFLDVDCIPATDFITQYAAALKLGNKLWSGQVRYLNKGFSSDWSDTKLEATLEPSQKTAKQIKSKPGFGIDLFSLSKPDPIRGSLKSLPYELFWSLNFGCSKAVFEEIGGFNEDYTGYGAEDTDFSFRARAAGIELAMVDATAFHQPHASYAPPLNHMEDIVKNAQVFYNSWQHWPMEGWLKQFAAMGYVSWTENKLNILSYPSAAVIEKHLR